MDLHAACHDGSRSAAIVIHDNKILLMHRKKDAHEYYAFPGGTVEECETLEHGALRELYEETSIKAEIVRLLYHVKVHKGMNMKDEYFFLCTYISGTPQLMHDAIEQQRMRAGGQLYEPLWAPLDQLPSLIIYPEKIKNQLIDDLQKGLLETYQIVR